MHFLASLLACEDKEIMYVAVWERSLYFFIKHILTQFRDKEPEEALAILLGCQTSLKINLVENKENCIYLGLSKILISENKFKCLYRVF